MKKIKRVIKAAVIAAIVTILAIPFSAYGAELKQGSDFQYNVDVYGETFTVDGNTAYCVNPLLPIPALGNYTPKQIDNVNLLKVLYYGYGGIGFNNTIKAKMDGYRNNQNITASGKDLYYGITRRCAAKAYGSNYKFDYYTDWNTAIDAMYAYFQSLSTPADAKVYVINQGNSSSQAIAYLVEDEKIVLEIQKKSSKSSFTNGNSAYSLEGAQFVIFTDKSKAEAAAKAAPDTTARGVGRVQPGSYAQTDSSGVAKFYNLGYSGNGVTEAVVPANTYYLVEYRAPKVKGAYQGYEASNTVYTFTRTGKVNSAGIPIYSATVNEIPKLELKITKRSADISITEGNSCYSLANARYGIYDSKEDADNNVNLRGVITTDENGNGTYSNSQGSVIPAKDFWGKELTASKGCALDPDAHHFTYSGERDSSGFPIYSFESVEKPETDPITVLLQKYDVTTGKGTNTEKLADAEYTVKFYPAYYASIEEIGENQPLRSWVFKTNANGRINYSPNYLVSGDEFWYDDFDGEKIPSLPYGTITVEETKAPTGYLINPDIYLANIEEGGGNISWRTTNENIDGSVLLFPETPTETFISKTDITGSKEVVGAALMVCEADNLSTPVDEWISAEEPHRIEGLEREKEYVLIEKIPSDGYVTAEIITFKVNEDGSATYITMKDDVTKVEILKVDTDNQPISGIELQILNSDSSEIVVPTWTTDGNPHRIDSKLIVGKTYRLHEVSTLPNYTLADDVVFTIEDTPDVQTVTMVNESATGSVTLHKRDGENQPLGGSQWQLFSVDDENLSVNAVDVGTYKLSENGQIQTLSTDDNGDLTISELPFGEYYFVEVTAPDGTMVYGRKLPFSISGNDENSKFAELTVKDNPTVLFNTGSIGVMPIYIAGAAALTLVIAAYFIYHIIKKKNKKTGVNQNENHS